MWMMGWLALQAFAGDPALQTGAKVHTLDNGLTVILDEDHRTDTVALHLSYNVGARDEQDGEYGCAHLFEHLMFEGSANVPTNAFDEWLTAAGGENNAFTSEDQTAYHMTFPSGALDMALFLESDRMAFLDAGLNEDNVANQQKVVLQERAEGYAEPHGRDWDALVRVGWPEDHPYHHPVIGTVADIEGFAIDKVRGFWEKHYRPRNATLTLVGRFDSDEALAAVEHWFSDVADKGDAPERAEAQSVGTRGARDGLLYDQVEDRSLVLSWPAPGINHRDEPALELLSYVLSYGRGTRLDDALYYNSKLATGVGAYYFASEIGGQFLIEASSDKTSLAKLDKSIDKTMAKLVKKPPTVEDLDRFRTAVRAEWLSDLERLDSRAERLTDCYKHTGDANCLSNQWDRYKAVTPDDIVAVAQKYLSDEARSTLSVVPVGDDGALDGAQEVELP